MAVECFEVIPSGILAGQFVQNVFHVNVNVAGGATPFLTADRLCAEFVQGANLIELYCGALPVGYQCTSLRCRRILPSGGPTQIYLAGSMAESVGQRPGDVSATQVCPVIIWIPTTNPQKTGRTFMPGVSEDDISSNVMDGSLLTALGDFGTFFTAGGTLSGGDTWDAAIYRRAAVTAHGIDDFRVSPVIGTQRRRLHPV